MKPAIFRLESFPGRHFSGYSNNETWNGWACPYFSFEEAQKIASAQNELTNVSAFYDQERDCFVFDFSDEIEEYVAVSLQEEEVYPIGNGAWIWEEITSFTD